MGCLQSNQLGEEGVVLSVGDPRRVALVVRSTGFLDLVNQVCPACPGALSLCHARRLSPATDIRAGC